MTAPGEQVGSHGVFQGVAFFLQKRHIPGQGGGVAGYVDDAPGGHPVQGFDGVGVEALPGRIHHHHIGADAVFLQFQSGGAGISAEELRVFDAVAFGVVFGILHSLGDHLHAHDFTGGRGHGKGDGANTAVQVQHQIVFGDFRLSPRSFYQVNHHQAQRLYEAAISQAEITKNDTVLDLYCGVGTITLAMAKAAGKVIGVEVVEQAVADAKDNARRNGIDNAEFFCGDAGAAALELEKQGIIPDVVVVDPPRKGLNADTIEALHRMQPRRIVYVSCDPATLARDVALLKERGYVLKNAMAADLFPRCAHVESVVTLAKEAL